MFLGSTVIDGYNRQTNLAVGSRHLMLKSQIDDAIADIVVAFAREGDAINSLKSTEKKITKGKKAKGKIEC